MLHRKESAMYITTGRIHGTQRHAAGRREANRATTSFTSVGNEAERVMAADVHPSHHG
jgi:hypothetical protein